MGAEAVILNEGKNFWEVGGKACYFKLTNTGDGKYTVADGLRSWKITGMDAAAFDFLKIQGKLPEDFSGTIKFGAKTVSVVDFNQAIHDDFKKRMATEKAFRNKIVISLEPKQVYAEEGRLPVYSPTLARNIDPAYFALPLPKSKFRLEVGSDAFETTYKLQVDKSNRAIKEAERGNFTYFEKALGLLANSLSSPSGTEQSCDVMFDVMRQLQLSNSLQTDFRGVKAFWGKNEVEFTSVDQIAEASKTDAGRTWLTGIAQNWLVKRTVQLCSDGYLSLEQATTILLYTSKDSSYGKGAYRKYQEAFIDRLGQAILSGDSEQVKGVLKTAENPVDYRDVDQRTNGKGWKAFGKSTIRFFMLVAQLEEREPELERIETPVYYGKITLHPSRRELYEDRNVATQMDGLVEPARTGTKVDLETMDPSFQYVIFARGLHQAEGSYFFAGGTKFRYECLVMPKDATEKTPTYDASQIKQQVALVIGDDLFVFRDKKSGLLVRPEGDTIRLLYQSQKGGKDFATLLAENNIEQIRIGSMNKDRTAITDIDPNYRSLIYSVIKKESVKFTPQDDGTYTFTLPIRARGGIRSELSYQGMVEAVYRGESSRVEYREKAPSKAPGDTTVAAAASTVKVVDVVAANKNEHARLFADYGRIYATLMGKPKEEMPPYKYVSRYAKELKANSDFAYLVDLNNANFKEVREVRLELDRLGRLLGNRKSAGEVDEALGALFIKMDTLRGGIKRETDGVRDYLLMKTRAIQETGTGLPVAAVKVEMIPLLQPENRAKLQYLAVSYNAFYSGTEQVSFPVLDTLTPKLLRSTVTDFVYAMASRGLFDNTGVFDNAGPRKKGRLFHELDLQSDVQMAAINKITEDILQNGITLNSATFKALANYADEKAARPAAGQVPASTIEMQRGNAAARATGKADEERRREDEARDSGARPPSQPAQAAEEEGLDELFKAEEGGKSPKRRKK